MKIKKSVKEAMKQLQIKKLRRNQIKPINSVLDGRDTMVIAPTSYGKSLLYQIPAIVNGKKLTVVIEPLLALIHDQVKKLQGLGIAAFYLDSTQSKPEQRRVMELLDEGKVTLLYIAPERLETGILLQLERHNKISLVVIDECHCVVSWGYAFRKSYLEIGKWVGCLRKKPVILALSATAVPEDRPQIMELLSMKDVRMFEESLYRSNLTFLKRMAPTRKDQQKELECSMKKYHRHTTIVFCNTKMAVENVAAYLEKLYPDEVMAYHSGKKREEKAMLTGKKHIIVATSALSMGVDVRNVDLVIHFNMPLSLADYYQMSGRAGREGQKARSILLYSPNDYYTGLAMIDDVENKEFRKLAEQRLDEMKEFCDDRERCMVQVMLHALGDTYTRKCRYCTNCQKER